VSDGIAVLVRRGVRGRKCHVGLISARQSRQSGKNRRRTWIGGVKTTCTSRKRPLLHDEEAIDLVTSTRHGEGVNCTVIKRVKYVKGIG